MTGRKLIGSAAAAAFAFSLAACSGGGSNSLPSTPSQPVGNAKQADAQMVVKIPAKPATTSALKPQYISASTQSMTIGLLANGKTTQIAQADLTPASPNCAPVTGGGTQCTVKLVAAEGAQTFVLSMYDQTGGKGNLLSTGNVAVTLVAGKDTNVPVTLDGVPASSSVVLGTGSLPVGTAGTTSVTVNALDAAGNYIVGPGNFSTPIALAISGDTHKTLSLSSTSVTAPGQTLTLKYNGGSNVGSTIAPSIGTAAGTPAAFNATGMSVLSAGGWSDSADGYYPYPYSVAALPNGNAVVQWEQSQCCWTQVTSLGVASPNGAQSMYVGTVTDPYASPAPSPSPYANMTVVSGMAQQQASWWGEQDNSLAASPDGTKVYYGGVYSSTNDPNCPSGGTSSFGSIGAFDPVAHTTTEKMLKGVPMYLQTDAAGNVWFIEESGACNGTAYFTSGYAVGKLSTSGTVSETDIAQTGFTANDYPGAMSISADGSQMFIGDYDNNTVLKVATSSLSGGTIVTPPNLSYISALATTPDGTTMWWSDTEPNYNYYYGFVPGSKTFADANVVENTFPLAGYYTYAMAYGDGSVWAGGDEYGTGVARFTFGSGAPTVNYYTEPNASEYGQYQDGISVNGGYLWVTDDDYDQVFAYQYGAASASLVSSQARMKTAAMVLGGMTKNPARRHMLNHPGYGKPVKQHGF
jgi:sugar lactone lactonase YvrE